MSRNYMQGLVCSVCLLHPESLVRSGAPLVLQQHTELLLITLLLVEECSGEECR